jgi:hypothetical protein
VLLKQTPTIKVAAPSSLPALNMFFIIGAMKAGTTSLHEHLASHPELFACPQKEPRFFLNADPKADDVRAYEGLFSARAEERWCFESSTGYSKAPTRGGVPRRIHDRFPQSRLVYVLRDPIERIYSEYLHNYAHGREIQSFAQAVAGNDLYLDTSRYYMQISCYLEYFRPDQLCLVILEEFSRDKAATLRRVFEFLEVDPDFLPPNTDKVFHQTSLRTMLPFGLQRLHFQTRRLRARLAGIPVLRAVANAAAAPLRLLSKPVPNQAALRDRATEQMLRERLLKDVAQLENYLGRSLDCWKTMKGRAE